MPQTPDPLAGLSPLVKQIVTHVGRRADDPELLAFVGGTLGQKVPATVADRAGGKNVTAKKHGLELVFDHDIKNEKYPLVPKTAKSFIPYLSLVWLTSKFEELPFGIAFGMDPDEVTKLFGVEPVGSGKALRWERVLDADRAIKLDFDGRECRIVVEKVRELTSRYGVPAKPVVGVFVAWAARRGLLDPARAGAHAGLFEEVRAGRRKGSELLAAAWPRGLWDIHLVDKPGLRRFAHSWFHRLGAVGYITTDLISAFGKREGPHGHDEPVLDDDDAAAVSKATPKLDAVFAAWLG